MADRDAPARDSSDADTSLYDERLDDPFPHDSEHLHNTSRRSLDLGPRRQPSVRSIARGDSHPIRYAFAQAFGERGADSTAAVVVEEADMISAVRFNDDSDMVATGDKGGRIVILKRVYRGKQQKRRDVASSRSARRRRGPNIPSSADDSLEDDAEVRDDSDDNDLTPRAPEFRFWTQFQSHEPEFDYLKSMEIEEKINQIRWCRQVSGSQRLIATNDKTIKMWRVYEKDIKHLVSLDSTAVPGRHANNYGANSYGYQPSHSPSSSHTPRSPQSPQSAALEDAHNPQHSPSSRDRENAFLRIPRMEFRGRVITASPRRVYSNAHAYHINSISLNSDEETFLSADDLRVNLWNLHRSGRGFNILDIKPDNMEDLTEVITAAEFHPEHCHLFVHSSSRGVVKLCDLRAAALCETWARQFEEPEDRSSRTSFFSEIIASISDVKFSPDGQFILTRDYMNLRLWDVRMERSPVLVVPVHEHLRSRLCDLYENDCIFDKFQCCFSSNGGSLLTGSYNSLFQSYSAYDGTGAAVEASVDFVSGLSGRHHYSAEGLSTNLIAGSSAQELVDPSRRIMHLDSSPTEDIAAVAAGPALYLYYGAKR